MSILEKATKDRKKLPRRTLIYGTAGIGKTTLASKFPNPILIPTEDGFQDIDIASVPLVVSLGTFKEYLMALDTEEHEYETVVIDSIDHLEKLVHKHVVERQKTKVDSIADIGFGKGYAQASDIFNVIFSYLNQLRNKGMQVVLIAHAAMIKVEPPDGASYTRYSPKLHTNSRGEGAGATVLEWCDEVFFANYKTYTRTEDEGFGKERSIATGSGERVLYTQERPGWLAKNRLGLPEEIPMDGEKYVSNYLV